MKRLMRRSKRITPFLGAMLLTLLIIAPHSVISAPIKIPFDETQLDGIVKDKDWLLVLGRAFFWDQQMGSDGGSCASCHFSAGTDSRRTGQMNPAFRAGGAPDTNFGCTQGERCINGNETGSGGIAGSDYTFVESDYPFRQLEDVKDRHSKILINSNDIHSSAGSFDAEFKKAFYGREICGKPKNDLFYKEGKGYWHGKRLAKRAVEPRNTAITINSGMSFSLAWDGRANNIFSGVGVHGLTDIKNNPNKRLIKMDGYTPTLTHIEIKNAALASFSVGPILDNLEMSCEGRTFADVARKILYTRPLRLQRIAKTDSTFGIHGPKGDIRAKGRGLSHKLKYYKLIKLAFEDDWWKGKGLFKIEDGKLKKVRSYKHGHTQMEMNFPMFWGLALQAYQNTLVSDQSKFDTAEAAGCFEPTTVQNPNFNPNLPPIPPNTPTISTFENIPECVSKGLWTEAEERGRVVFNGRGGCAACHGGNMFTNAAMDNDGSFPAGPMVLLSFGPPNALPILADQGFQNTGANLLAQDLGRMDKDPYGYPISFAMQMIKWKKGEMPEDKLDPNVDICNIIPIGPNAGPQGGPICLPDGSINPARQAFVDNLANQRIEVGGAMKSPSLRNIGLTAPFFHYGGYSNLQDIMDFYQRGGSARNIPEGCNPGPGPQANCTGDTSGNGPRGHQDFEDIDPNNRGSNVAGAMGVVNLRNDELDDVIKYMLSLTDKRVQCDADVFDHPELFIFTDSKGIDRNWDYRADDIIFRLPEVGIEGYENSHPELCLPNEGNLFAPGAGKRVGDDDRPITTKDLLGGL